MTSFEVHTSLTINPKQEVSSLGPEVEQLVDYLGDHLDTNDLGDETKFQLIVVGEEGDKYSIELTYKTYLDFVDKHSLSEFILNAINNDRKRLLNNIYYA